MFSRMAHVTGSVLRKVQPRRAKSDRKQRRRPTGTGWHVYRLETKGTSIRLLIDGVTWMEGSANVAFDAFCHCLPSGRITGLWNQATQLNVRGFRVFAL